MLARFWTRFISLGSQQWVPEQGQSGAGVGTAPASGLLREAALTAGAGLAVFFFGVLLVLRDPGFFWHDDYQVYYLAGFREVARAWSEGEFPLLSPCSWNGGALAGEYQYCVFSFFVTACVLVAFSLGLPLPLTAAALSLVHLAVLAMGAFRLGRRKGLTADLSLLVALVAALNGWIMVWGAMAWFTALASFAWVPWVWWGLDRSLDNRATVARFVPAGIFIYLTVSAGSPFTVLMIAILSVWMLLRAWCERKMFLPLWPVMAAWGVGLGLSSPAWLMLIEYSNHTARAQTPSLRPEREWMVPLSSLPGLVFPAWITFWKGFAGEWKRHMCAEMSGGLVPFVLVAVAMRHVGRPLLRSLRWEIALGVFTLVLAVLPGLGNFRFSFRWLPLFFLILSLVAAHALAAVRVRAESSAASVPEGAGPCCGVGSNLGIWATFLVLLVWVRALTLGLDPTATTWFHGLCLVAVCLGWTLVEARWPPSSACRVWMPCAVVLVSSWLTYLNVSRFMEVTTWQIDKGCQQLSLDPDVCYFSVHMDTDIFDGEDARVVDKVRGVGAGLYPGNSSMYADVPLVNGYSPMRPAGLTQIFDFSIWGFLHRGVAEWVLAEETGPDRLLAQMGVDGLIVSDQFTDEWPHLLANGWMPAGPVEGGMVFHRSGPTRPRVRALMQAEQVPDRNEALNRLVLREGRPSPWILLGGKGQQVSEQLDFAPAELTIVEETRNRVVVHVRRTGGEDEALVVFTRPWFPGYRATCNGRALPVEILNLTMPAVRLPPGSEGRLVLEYRPRSLVVGCWLASAAGVVVIVALVLAVRQRLGRVRAT